MGNNSTANVPQLPSRGRASRKQTEEGHRKSYSAMENLEDSLVKYVSDLRDIKSQLDSFSNTSNFPRLVKEWRRGQCARPGPADRRNKAVSSSCCQRRHCDTRGGELARTFIRAKYNLQSRSRQAQSAATNKTVEEEVSDQQLVRRMRKLMSTRRNCGESLLDGTPTNSLAHIKKLLAKDGFKRPAHLKVRIVRVSYQDQLAPATTTETRSSGREMLCEFPIAVRRRGRPRPDMYSLEER